MLVTMRNLVAITVWIPTMMFVGEDYDVDGNAGRIMGMKFAWYANDANVRGPKWSPKFGRRLIETINLYQDGEEKVEDATSLTLICSFLIE